MAVASEIESEIKSWLQIALTEDNLKELSVKVLGNSEKGDGYMGDIVFAFVSGVTENGSTKEYNLVLKCGKRSEALRKQSPVREVFLNEIYIYKELLPAYTQFQLDKGIEDPFDSVPKCYGTFVSGDMEVIVLENLKKVGYDLWDRKKPLSREHIDMVMKEYGKFHAISVAIQDQQPEKFKKILAPFKHTFDKFKESGNSNILFSSSIEEVYDLLKDDLEESIMNRWKNFKQQVDFVLNDISEDLDGLKVIVHGDCWNNNFMYYSENNEKNLPKKVALLDWQMSRFTTPITDLSYFLFACISQEDLENLNDILRNYYKSFSQHLKRLGSDPDRLYSFDQLLKDWKTYCKYGIMMASVILKIALTEKDEIVDIAQAAEQGQDIVSSFSYEIQNKTPLRNRLRPFVKYVVEHDLV